MIIVLKPHASPEKEAQLRQYVEGLGFTVQDIAGLERFVVEQPVDIAVLAVPAQEAQSMAEKLYALGVKGFWNFAPVDLKLPRGAVAENVHLDESLEVLSFRIMLE